jgi:DNA modification methylase
MTFESEEARRAWFLERLRQHLQDPAFRAQPGFPRASDEDILRLSDPPFYTACPNPFLGELVTRWASERKGGPYAREPFVADVAEGKNDPIYNAHSYHTKVPHRAIQKYLEHYTEPGDIVLDCFCGTGQTGVACAELPEPRRAILCDLSPAASLVAYNFCTAGGEEEQGRALDEVLGRLGARYAWMYETRHTGWPASDRRLRKTVAENPGGPSEVRGAVQFVLWSDVFRCPECGGRIVYWFAAASEQEAGLADTLSCPSCRARLARADLERVWGTTHDTRLGRELRTVRREPVLIQYEVKGRVFHKVPDEEDLALIARSDATEIPEWYPTGALPDGDKTAEPKAVGITHAHLFYTHRGLAVLAGLWREISTAEPPLRGALQFLFTSTLPWTTRMNRLLVSNFFRKRGGVIGQTLSGTLYVSSLSVETNPLYRLRLRERSAAHRARSAGCCVTTQSATELRQLPADSVDYVFIDPPFGRNLVYSDLNFLWESWLGVSTARECEAIVSAAQRKGLGEYEELMRQAFREIRRVLRPGRWVTVVFHNSQDAVWRAIQQAMGEAGLVVSQVSVLEKKHGTYNQVTAAGAVRKDLAISAYKAGRELEEVFRLEQVGEPAAWQLVRGLLERLPVVRQAEEAPSPLPERQAPSLFGQMVAFFVQRHMAVPLSARDFYEGLAQRFSERDGMYFLPEQAQEYDRLRAEGGGGAAGRARRHR